MQRVFIFWLLFASPGFAEENASEPQPLWDDDNPPEFLADDSSPFRLTDDPTRKRNYFWPALFSIPLPGLDQWLEGQSYAGIYSGIGAVSLFYAYDNIPPERKRGETDSEYMHRQINGVKERKFAFGFQTYQSMGGLSAYHSFRSAVRSRAGYGEFSFLTKEETIADLLLAPFQFSWIKKPTTFIPLSIVSFYYLASIYYAPNVDDTITREPLTTADATFAGLISYNAGTHEEAVFRGWLMPMFMEWWQTPFWSNTATASLFALAHLSDGNRLPLPQLALGWHLGYVTQRNDWTLAESIFIHTWWDVIAFLTVYQLKFSDESGRIQEPKLWLPPLVMHF